MFMFPNTLRNAEGAINLSNFRFLTKEKESLKLMALSCYH